MYMVCHRPADMRQDDFEVSIFLTELSSRHSVLTQQKRFKDKARIQSNSGKLTNWLGTGASKQPVMVNEDAVPTILLREEDDGDEAIQLADIPEATRRSARNLGTTSSRMSGSSESDGSGWLVEESQNGRLSDAVLPADDEKKFRVDTCYEGFSIYGRILCLVIKRRGVRSQAGAAVAVSSQAMMENWVSTQAAAEPAGADDD